MEKENEIKSKSVQTYAEDMAGVLEGDKEGLIKKIIHQEEEHEALKRSMSPESRKNKLFMFAGMFFIITTCAILFPLYFNRKDMGTVEVVAQFKPIIFNDKSDFIEIFEFNKDKIVETVYSTVNKTEVKTGGLEGVYLAENKKVIGWSRFVAFIKGSFVSPSAPDGGSFVSENFLMGVVNNQLPLSTSSGKDFFILLQVRSIPDVFNSMRAWENKMFSDLHGFFGINFSSDTSYLLTKNFDNGIIENKNARILYDKDGKIVMMYIYADDNSVIITGTTEAAHEIMLRLASSEIKK